MAQKSGPLYQRNCATKLPFREQVNSAGKGSMSFYSGGIIISTPKSIIPTGASSINKNYSKPINTTETNGSTYPGSFQAGKSIFLYRTDNSIKNHFYSTIRKCLRRINKLHG